MLSDNYIEIQEDEKSDTKHSEYTNFRATYKLITFAMGIGLIYPNPETDRRRMTCILIILLSITPVSFMILLDMFNSWLRRDIINVIRHCTVVGPFLGGFFKMFVMFYKRAPAERIIAEIDRDYAAYNRLPRAYKALVDASVRNNLTYTERCWAVCVAICVLTFPIMAIVLNTYSSLFKSEPTKYMVHDMNKPFSEPHERFESPFFEIMFFYMIYCSVLYVINFTGYDGFFGLAINHACLKMELYCKAFEDAFKAESKAEIREKVAGVIKEQNRLFDFVELIQETFNIWLGLILIATMIQICNCMYHITEGYELDLRYIIFIIGTIAHIYLPCRYSAKLKDMSLLTSTLLYCGGWESVVDVSLGRTVQFMIARGQVPTEITAFNMLVFDMELFVSLLQTSYSMYTLLRS